MGWFLLCLSMSILSFAVRLDENYCLRLVSMIELSNRGENTVWFAVFSADSDDE